MKLELSEVVGHACAHDSSLDVHLGTFSGFRVVVTAVLMNFVPTMTQQSKEKLHELGF